jgi:hypothetical protein
VEENRKIKPNYSHGTIAINKEASIKISPNHLSKSTLSCSIFFFVLTFFYLKKETMVAGNMAQVVESLPSKDKAQFPILPKKKN